MDPQIVERAARIRLAIFDVDGVFTDGRLYYGPDGLELKAFHARDGHGIKQLRAAGVMVAVISGRQSEAVARRMAELGIDETIQDRSEKRPVFHALLEQFEVDESECAAIGDDLPELPLLQASGLAIAVADAHQRIREAAHWITPSPGGHGAVRDVTDLLMMARKP
jgi:3-deoxy-D-manno-octulosonate 8-phosphate phosphatase (KDO 8-P phosphatase)